MVILVIEVEEEVEVVGVELLLVEEEEIVVKK